ncbi:hypothetical protein [Anaerocolumna sp. MB42-C2]|uniref:hypothetical protein n=1 Tax=Anaerocolumna sp. MB42-C2 TaxID=3070997 RepID=UPI0027DF3592|nr:hypothetical protein [Anaerocolumna sp. MB42-C2]WMJ88322.1 hypothetical protein RBU59_02085 [Anaerocolumna sp. MB42-C2]
MDAQDTIISDESTFLILKCDMKTIFEPENVGISPIWSNDPNFRYNSDFEIKDYQLYLKNLIITGDIGYPIINGIKPEPFYSEKGPETVQYNNIMISVKFSGAIVIGNTFIKNYGTEDEIPCYSYKVVWELIFQDGRLVTTIDHSKAMLRVRKNLDLGLRNLNKTRDMKCIKHYIKFSFVGDYDRPGKMSKCSNKKKIPFQSYAQKIKNYYSRIKSFQI